VRHEVVSAVRDFFNDQGFILADTPIFTPAACEGTTTLFPVDYFEDQKVFLTQSGQLYAEANAMALGRVYNFGPVFRAEKSKTRRHLTEFWMVEPEMAYATLDDVIDLAEGLVVAGGVASARKTASRAQVLDRDTSKLEAVKRLPAISYDEAVKSLREGPAVPNGGATLGAPTKRSTRSSSIGLWRFIAIPQRSSPSTWSRSRAAGAGVVRRLLAPGRLGAKSSAAASVSPATTRWCSDQGTQPSAGSFRVGTWTCAVSPPFRTPGSAWASNASWAGSAASSNVREASPFPRKMNRVLRKQRLYSDRD
jgi:hypothetical protein